MQMKMVGAIAGCLLGTGISIAIVLAINTVAPVAAWFLGSCLGGSGFLFGWLIGSSIGASK